VANVLAGAWIGLSELDRQIRILLERSSATRGRSSHLYFDLQIAEARPELS
jgi:hypothetical protein